MQFYIAIFFTIVAAAAIVLQLLPKLSLNKEQPYAFPLLAMIAIDLVALLAPVPVNLFYKGAILLGLLIATLAVVFYHVPKTPSYIAFAHLLIVHFLYFLAFSSANSIAIPSPILLLIIAYAVLIYWYGHDHVKEQRGALIAYIVLMSFMVWAASESWVQHEALWATAAFVGAVLLVISSTLRLIMSVWRSALWLTMVMSAGFYLGQLLIAWSVWGFVSL